MIFKYAVGVPPHSSFHILSQLILPNSTLNVSTSTDQQGTSIRTLNIYLVTISIGNNNSNSNTLGKAVNDLKKVIHDIEVDANKVKLAPWKIKQPNLEVMKYIKGEKYPKAEVGKNIYAVREGEYREGRQYVRIKLSIAHDVTWGD